MVNLRCFYDFSAKNMHFQKFKDLQIQFTGDFNNPLIHLWSAVLIAEYHSRSPTHSRLPTHSLLPTHSRFPNHFQLAPNFSYY